MKWALAGAVFVCTIAAQVSGSGRSGYTHHQVYNATRAEAVRAIETVFTRVGGGLLGADWENGMVVSKGVRGQPRDVETITKVNPDAAVVYFLVALVEPRKQDQVEIQILTVLSARTKQDRNAEGGFYTSGNALTERIYDELAGPLGPGVLVPIGH